MSARPTLRKQLKRLRKAQRRSLPRYFDIIDWLKMRRHAQTTGEAKRLILDGRLRSGSHTVGIVEIDVPQADGSVLKEPTVARVQPVVFRDELIVLAAKP